MLIHAFPLFVFNILNKEYTLSDYIRYDKLPVVL